VYSGIIKYLKKALKVVAIILLTFLEHLYDLIKAAIKYLLELLVILYDKLFERKDNVRIISVTKPSQKPKPIKFKPQVYYKLNEAIKTKL